MTPSKAAAVLVAVRHGCERKVRIGCCAFERKIGWQMLRWTKLRCDGYEQERLKQDWNKKCQENTSAAVDGKEPVS